MAMPRYAWLGAAAAWLYGYAQLIRYENELRFGTEPQQYFQRTLSGMRLFAAFTVLFLALNR